jgi:uncharacterized protein YrrD
MKRSVNSVIGYAIGALDGEIGKVKEFYFDDVTWTIRYLIVETGSWLSGRKVLIATEALLKPRWDVSIFPVNLTKEQIENSPDIDTEKTVSRLQEIKLYEYYPWTSYWGKGLWTGDLGTTGMVLPIQDPLDIAVKKEIGDIPVKETKVNSTLRSTNDVKGYTIHAIDGEIGDVADFIFDDSDWKISYMVVDTGNWFPGKKVLLFPDLIKEIKWVTSVVIVDTTVNSIKNSPKYDQHNPIDELYETELSNYYRKT